MSVKWSAGGTNVTVELNNNHDFKFEFELFSSVENYILRSNHILFFASLHLQWHRNASPWEYNHVLSSWSQSVHHILFFQQMSGLLHDSHFSSLLFWSSTVNVWFMAQIRKCSTSITPSRKYQLNINHRQQLFQLKVDSWFKVGYEGDFLIIDN